MGLTAWVASLGYELLDDPMEQDPFVEIRLAKLDEIIAMKRGVVIQTYGDIAHRCLYRDVDRLARLQRLLAAAAEDKAYKAY